MALLVTGRIDRPTLDRTLYDGWRVVLFQQGANGNVALVTHDDGIEDTGFGPRAQTERLRSLGTVGVTSNPTPDEVLDAMRRAGL